MRSNSGVRVHSRENLQPAAIRRAPTPNATAKQNGGKQKPDFSISSPDEGEDDDGAEVAEEVFLLHLVPRVEDDRREQEVEEQRVVECLSA